MQNTLKVNLPESYHAHWKLEGYTNRNFGFTFTVIFAAIGALIAWKHQTFVVWPFITSLTFFLVTVFREGWLTPFNRLWFQVGLLLNRVMSIVVLSAMFFLIFTPMALVMRLCQQDVLNLRLDPKRPSYWNPKQPKGPPPQAMRQSF